MLYINKDRKIRYNYLKLVAVYKVLILNQETKIKEVQSEDLKYKDYKY